MRPDPKVTANCATCGNPRHPERSRKYAQGQAEADAFCSTSCCRIWHGAAIPQTRPYIGKPEYIPIHGTTAAYSSGCRCDACRAAEATKQRERRARQREAAPV